MSHPFRERAGAMVGRVFARLGAEADYAAPGASGLVRLRAIPLLEDVDSIGIEGFANRTLQTRRVFAILSGDVAARPAKGAGLSLLTAGGGSELYSVTETAMNPPRDPLALVWLLAVSEPFGAWAMDFQQPLNSMYLGQGV